MGNYLERPIFICGHRKTGTTMLINLFDGAKDAVVFPDDSTLFYMYFPRYLSNRYTRDEKIERLAEIVIEQILGKKIDRANCSEEEKARLKTHLQKFKEDIYSYPHDRIEWDSILKYFFDSYNKRFLKIASPSVWIEKTTSTEIYALEMSELFPEAKFVHLIRDPRDNWGSLKSGWEKRYKDYNDEQRRLLQSLIERGKLGMEMGRLNYEVLGKERYFLIKYEDLTRDPEKWMQKLADFVGINYTDNLLKPSTFGHIWKGNNFEGKKYQKPSTVNVDRWKERISDHEARLIEFHFRDMMDYFGYSKHFNLSEQMLAASEHYKWFNFSTPYSAG